MVQELISEIQETKEDIVDLENDLLGLLVRRNAQVRNDDDYEGLEYDIKKDLDEARNMRKAFEAKLSSLTSYRDILRQDMDEVDKIYAEYKSISGSE